MRDSRSTSEGDDELPLILRIRTSQGGAALIFFAVLLIGASLAMWLETRGPVRPLTHTLFSLVPWPASVVGPTFCVTQLVLALLVIFGGVHLRQLGSAPMTRIAAVLALLPFTSLWLLGLPLALNALFVVRDPRVRARMGGHSPTAT